jgi:hypothetical protein
MACSRKGEKNEAVNDKRVLITPFKISKVMLRDTTQIRSIYAETDSGRISISDYIEGYDKETKFFNLYQFKLLYQAVWALIKNPGSKIYVDPNSKPAALQEVKDRIMKCDMVELSSFDAEGNEIVQSKYMCDSTTAIYNINQIRFFEAWYFNPENNMIERDLLGYSVHEYVKDKFAFRELFNVFKDSLALEQAKKYYFNKH